MENPFKLILERLDRIEKAIEKIKSKHLNSCKNVNKIHSNYGFPYYSIVSFFVCLQSIYN